MTPLPSPTPSTTSHYNNLISILTSITTALEIDILPSSFPPTIHYISSPPSLGIPKALLTPLFLIAHGHFFSYLKLHGSPQRSHTEKEGGREEGSCKQALDATTVLLLWDPNHVTAANFRRRYIVGVCEEDTVRNDGDEKATTAAAAISRELNLLENLQTSPLPKHAKSSTLWSYRLWLLSRFHHLPFDGISAAPGFEDGEAQVQEDTAPALSSSRRFHHLPFDGTSAAPGDEDGEAQVQEDTAAISSSQRFKSELSIVMKAAERHPRNYHAWNYARDLLHLLAQSPSRPPVNHHTGNRGDQIFEATKMLKRELARASIKDVHRWCLQHPRDISGWGFLLFLMREVGGGDGGDGGGGKVGGCEGCGKPDGSGKPHGSYEHVKTAGDDNIASEIQHIIHQTQEFTRKYTWKGESLEWFLNAAKTDLLLHYNK